MAFGASQKTTGVPAGFVDALVQYADTLGNAQPLIDEFNALFAAIQQGQGKEIIASTINGKYFGFQVSMTTEEKFSAFGEAIRRYNGTAIVQTYPDFSQLQR